MLILIDANVLFSKILLTLLLDMANNEIFTFLWSNKILQETSKNLKLKQKISNPNSVDKLIADIEFSFALSEVHVHEYTTLEKDLVRTDQKDKHVLAAAAIGGAKYLVTFNLSDFDNNEAQSHDVIVIHPDIFLCTLLELKTSDVLESIKSSRTRQTRPTQTESELLERLRISKVSKFADELSQYLGQF
jgi:predicted nucleic acid-binding protein